MDLNTIKAVSRPRCRDDLRGFDEGDAWLAGGTWLFSEPQPRLRRLIDLNELGWEPLRFDREGLSIAATCTVACLDGAELPPAWTARPLLGLCCNAFLASFKVCSVATVGGNLCLGLPAGPMIALCAALDASCVVWTADGGERRISVFDLIIGAQRTSLCAGELLRSIELPHETLARRACFRRISLTPGGRSGALLIGTLSAAGDLALTVTASTIRPLRVAFGGIPDRQTLLEQLDRDVPPHLYHDDMHGRPDWRRAMTREFALEIRSDLEGRA